MRQRIENSLRIEVTGVDLTTAKNIEFYLQQGFSTWTYTPEVISATEMIVVIPVEHAKRLAATTCSMQFAFEDAGGNPRASEVVKVPVDVLLKEAGYDPV